jgi:hypothetical protein
MSHTLEHSGSDIFDHSAGETDTPISFNMLDQMMIYPVDEEGRSPLKTASERVSQGGYWQWRSSMWPCRMCDDPDNSDAGRRLLEERHISGFADAMVISLLESGMEYFQGTQCVTISCEELDVEDVSYGCQ